MTEHAHSLTLQAQHITPALAAQLANQCRATELICLNPFAYRLLGLNQVDHAATVLQFSQQHQLDVAWVPRSRRLDALGLIATDMDSTLITIECIDEIGALLGIKSRIAEITEQAMRGEIDFAESLRRRVAMLAGVELSALDTIYNHRLQLSPGAQTFIDVAHQLHIPLLLVSGGFTFFTDRLQTRLHLHASLANVLDVQDGRLTGRLNGPIVDAQAKAIKMQSVANELGVALHNTLAMGDGANDLPMLALAGVSVAYRAKPRVQAAATHALNFSGLDGALHLFE